MAVNGKSRRSYRGAPVSNTLGVMLAAGATSITLTTSVSGTWPTDSEPFFVVVDPGTAKEEKICVKYNTTTSLTIVDPAATSGWVASAAGRGADNTTDRQHEQGAVIYPVFTALEANQANELISKYANAGSIVYQGAGTPGTFTELAIGTSNYVLKSNSGVPQWGQITVDGIADGAVTSAKILDGTIVAGDIADGAITSAKILDGTIVLADLATALQAFLVPVGSINAYAGATAPTGWLLCDGTSTTGYTALAALVGATTPDLRGYTLVGKSASAPFNGALLSKFGSTTSTALHSHTVTLTETPSGSLTTVVPASGSGLIAQGSNSSSATTSESSVGVAHGNVQPSALINYIIKHD